MFWTSLICLAFLHLPVLGITEHASATTLPGRYHSTSKVINGRQHVPIDLVTASASGIEKGSTQDVKIDEDKKTLSQQVADGKYGLIQKELFINPVQRPGVISYESNSEVPKDNLNNLGGLNKSEIWLAENHLLVLKGGVFPVYEALPEYSKPVWPPIDDYAAPRRPVKLSKHPKVPPPFPVQLTDDGPLQILGTNFTRTLNDTFFPPPYAIPSLEGYEPGSGPFFPPQSSHPSNSTPGETPFATPPFYLPIPENNKSEGGLPPQFPFPINGALPPFFESLPPGSAILPPPNITDQFDEDDLSIYYPPPYSFYYPKDNTTEVPPGPLVPGIVLPPPPNFFGLYQKSTPKPETRKTTPRPVIHTTTRPKVIATLPTREKLRPVYHKPATPEYTTKKQSHQSHRNKTVNVTILKPIQTTKKPPQVYVYDNTISNKPFEEYGPPPSTGRQQKISISTTRIPLRAYFSTSSEADINLVTRLPAKQSYTTKNSLQKPKQKQSMQFYYYDDAPVTNSISTPYPIEQQTQTVNITKEFYSNTNQDSRKYSNPIVRVEPQYYFVPSKQYITQRPRNRVVSQTPSNNFRSHLIQIQKQIQAFQRPSTKQYQQNIFIGNQEQNVPTPKPVYQYSFEVANYKQQHERLQIPSSVPQRNNYQSIPKYTVQIEPAIEITTTEKPLYQNTPPPEYYQPIPPQKYYTSNVPTYNYQEQQKYSSAITPQPIAQHSFTVTPNPLYQNYYTKQDEQLFDDITKKYFTTFGKKLRSTTPIPIINTPANYNQGQIIYSSRVQGNQPHLVPPPPDLRGDILINYVKQRPAQNLASEFIQIPTQQNYPQVRKQVPQYIQPYQTQTFSQNRENYRQKIPQNNANVQSIQALSLPARSTIAEGKPGSFISYELPGDDGAHFYFLTPQLSQQNDRNSVAYYYTEPSNNRVRKNSQTRNN